MAIKKEPYKKTVIRVSVADYSKGLYQIALGAAAKLQQELHAQTALTQFHEKIDSNTLGLLATSLWLVKHIARQTLHRGDLISRCHDILDDLFMNYIKDAAGDSFQRKEIEDYLKQLHAIYEQAWNNTSDPGRTWWLAHAIAREILDTVEVPELANVIAVGEVETTLAMGVRLSKQYIVY